MHLRCGCRPARVALGDRPGGAGRHVELDWRRMVREDAARRGGAAGGHRARLLLHRRLGLLTAHFSLTL